MKSDHPLAGPLAMALALAMTACGGERNPPPADTAGALPTGIFPAPYQTHFVEYPVEGIDLGQGWHREGVSKAMATCVLFTTRQDTGQEQSMELSVVSDSSALMNKLNVSAEAQFKSIGYSVSGKARFAKETAVRSSSLNVLAYASVMNGVEYVAPAESGTLQRRIDLTQHYRELARRDRVAFEQECGDGFVAALYSGAELTAMLSFTESNTKARTAIEAAMSGSGFGFSAKGSARATMESNAATGKLHVTFYQTGGSGSPLPTTQEGFVGAIEELPTLAAKDPYHYRILVQSYTSLPGFPSDATDERDEFRQVLATSYGRLLTLRLATIEALEAPENYVDSHEDQTRPAIEKRMQALHDELLTRLRCIRGLADSYTYYDEDMGPRDKLAVPCELTADLDLRNDYAYRVRLPVLRSNVAGTSASDVASAIVHHHVRDVSRRRCERDLEDPGCLLESEIEKLRAHFFR